MPIEYKKSLAVFSDIVTVEEAEGLLDWMQNKSAAKVDLKACTHIHAANLQVLMAAKCNVTDWPEEPVLAAWLKSAL